MTDCLSARDILDRLVSFPTVSRDTNLPLVHWLQDYLEGHGIEVHRWIDPDQPHKAALMAHAGPRVEGAVVLSGHSDVVPVDGQDWDSDPFTVVERDGKYFGRGTCDMKGFDALAIWALVEGHHRGLRRPLQLALSFDEELGCTGAPPMIVEMQKVLPKGSAVIVGEPSMMQTVTGHKGGQTFAIEVWGHEVHSSIMHTGVSAVMEAARLIQWANEVNETEAARAPSEMAAMFDPPFTTLHTGMIEGGTAQNITARQCRFDLGFRAVPDQPHDLWRQRILGRIAEVEQAMQTIHPETRIDVDTRFGVPGLRPETEGEAEALVRALTGDNGSHVVSYGTEAGQFQQAGYSAVVCGPGDIAQAHQANEFITVAQFEAGHAFMRRLIERLVA
ncbi:acetylornithine deacetylase [Ruegeria marina]|nr:acetylornithine deacetylase [Ruegeria marina]